MRRIRTWLLMSALVAAAAAAHAAAPGAARASSVKHLWKIYSDGETCSGSCASGASCCTIIIAPPP
jgi:hypothetical protein